MAGHATKYNELTARGGLEFHYTWTDISSTALLLTPDFPAMRGPGRSKILGDINAAAEVTNLRDLAGNALEMPKYSVHQTDRVAVDYSGGSLQIKEIVSEPTTNAVQTKTALTGVKVGADVWLYDGKSLAAWEVVYYHIENGSTAAVAYHFEDEAGSPAVKAGPIHMNAYDHRLVDMPFQNTVDDRLYLKADKAAIGSITLWVVRASV